jgi:hypothetical protein
MLLRVLLQALDLKSFVINISLQVLNSLIVYFLCGAAESADYSASAARAVQTDA